MNSKKSFAVATAAAMGLAGFVAAPAMALDEAISLSPNDGLNYSVFLADTFDLDVDVDALTVNSTLNDNARLAVTNLDGQDSFTYTSEYFTDIVFDTGGAGTNDGTCDVRLTYTIVNAATGATSSNTVVAYSQTEATEAADSSSTTAKCITELATSQSITLADLAVEIPVAATTGAIVFDLSGGYQLNGTGEMVVDEDRTAADPYPSTQTVSFAPATSDDDYGDGDLTMDVQVWIETSALTLVDAAASSVQGLTFWDPENVSVISRIERFRTDGNSLLLNDADDTALAASIRFSKTVNLEQTTLSQWGYGLDSSTAASDFAVADGNNLTADYQDGFTDHDAFGRLMVTAALDSTGSQDVLVEDETYRLIVRHDEDDTTPRDFYSPGFQVLKNSDVSAVESSAIVDDEVDALTDSNGSTITLRSGVNSFDYVVQAAVAAGTADEAANIPVMAIVTAGAFIGSGATLTVSGSTQTITKAEQAVIVTGLTDADGQWTVTVTSSAAALSVDYDVDSYILNPTSGEWSNTAADNLDSALDATYATAAASEIVASTSVVAGTTPSVAFTVNDQFGQTISETATGAAYSVSLLAPDTDDVELYQAVTAGRTSFSFTNYLDEGSSDVLTATVYTGSSTAPVNTSVTTFVTVYNSTAASAINVSEEYAATVDVTYSDFITGEASETNVAPAAGDASTYSGSVLDVNGSGVPGVPVTISAADFQFESGDVYSLDTVSTITDETGNFSVDFWVHHADDEDGFDITVTTGDLSATTTVMTQVPTTLSAGNLALSWNVPAAVVTNTTYAITASVTDVWGNGVPSLTVVFSGYAAAQFNGDTTATKVTNASGEAVAYLRSLEDVDGLSAIGLQVTNDGDYTITDLADASIDDDEDTAWDESDWSDSLEMEITFLKTAPAADQKVNAGSFKGYVALYAKGYAGQRMSAKVGKDWVVVPALASNFERVVEFTGAGVDVAVRIYIDRVLLETINLTTK